MAGRADWLLALAVATLLPLLAMTAAEVGHHAPAGFQHGPVELR